MKRRRHLLKLAYAKKRIKEKRLARNQEEKANVYSYKCGNRNIKLTVQKTEVIKPSELLSQVFYYQCVFCGKDFDTQTQACPDCQKPLTRVNLKKCPQCGAKNNPLKQNCWICNAAFPKLELATEKETQLFLTLNVDGVFYRNTDPSLSLSLKKLFEDLITAGFSKEPLEAWVKAQEGALEYKKESLREECKILAQESKQSNLVYIILAVLSIGIIFLLFKVFWSG